MFGTFILPYLSPEGVLQAFDYFKKSNPDLNLPTFLEKYYFPFNIVWGLEEYIFYPFFLEKFSSQSLYSKKTKMPIIFESVSYSDFHREDVLALLPSKKIIAFQYRTFLSHNELLMLAKNADGYDFVVSLAKLDGDFSVIAHGAAFDINIFHNLQLIWKAYTSEYENFFLKFTRKITIPYIRYLRDCQVCFKNLYAKRCFLVKLIFNPVFMFVYMLPFHLVSFFINLLIAFYTPVKTGFFSIVFLSFVLFTIVTWRFIINIQKSLYAFDVHPKYLDIFAIEPKKLMWRFPFLVETENPKTWAEQIYSLMHLFGKYSWFSSLVFIFLVMPCVIIYENINGEYK